MSINVEFKVSKFSCLITWWFNKCVGSLGNWDDRQWNRDKASISAATIKFGVNI